MTQTIVIDEAEQSDIPEILSVRRITWIETYPNTELGITREEIEEHMTHRDMDAPGTWSKRLKEETIQSHTWVAKEHHSVVGFVSAQKSEEVNKIMALYVLPTHQKRGIGRELVMKALSWLGKAKNISLEVVSYNDQAIRFYKKYGFKENGMIECNAGKLLCGKHLPSIEMILIP